jgi:hypothetical protein
VPLEVLVQRLRDCQYRPVPIAGGPGSGRPGTLRTVLGRPPTRGVFFSVGLAAFQPGDLVSDLDELVGQFLEALVIGDIRLGLLGLISRNAFGTLGTLQIALQNVIRTLPGGPALMFLDEELLAESASAETVDGLDFLEDLFALAAQFGQCGWHHGILYLYRYNIKRKLRPGLIGFMNWLLCRHRPALISLGFVDPLDVCPKRSGIA